MSMALAVAVSYGSLSQDLRRVARSLEVWERWHSVLQLNN